MLSVQINDKALDSLSKQDFVNAQKLFFYNARKNPSHETFNNLGYFLISEGLIFQNGVVKSAHALGLKYLLKASAMKNSAVNLCALASAIEYELKGCPKKKSKILLRQELEYLKKILELEYSNETQYNYLRLVYMLDCDDQTLLLQVRDLVKKFVNTESVSLYLELLRIHSMREEALQCIEVYRGFLDEVDLLIFYTTLGLYAEGYNLCECVYEGFAVDEFIAAAILECCINTQHFEEAQLYAHHMKEDEANVCCRSSKKWIKSTFDSLDVSTNYRKGLVKGYKLSPTFLVPCCYYGCKIHGTNWE